jgi:hypothetical protein
VVGSLSSCASAPRVLYARSCFSVPLWAGRIWLPAPPLAALCSRLRIRLPEPIGYALERVSPAYYVELRALDIAKGEAEDSARIGYCKPHLLHWPFRWPQPATDEHTAVSRLPEHGPSQIDMQW